MTCRYCKFYDLEATKTANGRVISGRVARCQFPIEEMAFPASLGHRPVQRSLSYMGPKDGKDCPTYKARVAP